MLVLENKTWSQISGIISFQILKIEKEKLIKYQENGNYKEQKSMK